MRRIILLTCILVLASPSQAVSPELILGSEEGAEVQPQSSTPAEGDEAHAVVPVVSNEPSPLPELSLKTAKKQKALALTIQGGLSYRNYNLSSSGLSANFPGATGYEVEAAFSQEISATERISGNFITQGQTFSGITSITPSTFRVAAWQTSAQYSFILSGDTLSPSSSAWWFSVGYEMKKRTGVNGSPVTPLDEVWFHGPQVGFLYEGPKRWGNFGYALSTYVMIPWYFQEDIQTTGSFKYGLTSESTLMVRYELRETTTLALGIKFYLDYRNYVGTGTRGSTNATEIETVFTVPLSLQIRF